MPIWTSRIRLALVLRLREEKDLLCMGLENYAPDDTGS